MTLLAIKRMYKSGDSLIEGTNIINNSYFLTAYPSRTPKLNTGFTRGCVAQSFVFCAMFFTSCVVPFLLAILLSVLQFTASEYPLRILLFVLTLEVA